MGKPRELDSETTSKDNLVVNYYNRNKAQSNVMGKLTTPATDDLKRGLYKSTMNNGRVNWDDVA